MNDPKSTPKTAKVQLAKNHRHHGLYYAEKDVIEVADHLVAWFEENAIGKRYTGPEPAKNAAH